MSSLARVAEPLFTGKPHVDGLGYAFLFRNYRPGLIYTREWMASRVPVLRPPWS